MKDNTFGRNRRFFISGAAVVVVASFYIAAVGRGAFKACSNENIKAGLPLDVRSLIRIGNSYLKEHTKNGELTQDDVFLDETETRSANIADAIQRRLLAIDRQVREDFARCETVICDGWVLAKSEARLCAMIAARAGRV
jgi:hypothetical protein